MVTTPPGKLLKVLESLFSREWKVLEISAGSGKFWQCDVKIMESF